MNPVIGPNDGDFLTISSAWLRACITRRVRTTTKDRRQDIYPVSTFELRIEAADGVFEKTYKTVSAAMNEIAVQMRDVTQGGRGKRLL